ncbi:hypothetical protein Tco_1023367, partial [Tanacetum coccineum]
VWHHGKRNLFGRKEWALRLGIKVENLAYKNPWVTTVVLMSKRYEKVAGDMVKANFLTKVVKIAILIVGSAKTLHFEDVDYGDECIIETNNDLKNIYTNESTTDVASGDDDFSNMLYEINTMS